MTVDLGRPALPHRLPCFDGVADEAADGVYDAMFETAADYGRMNALFSRPSERAKEFFPAPSVINRC
jgi:hypothetical protein